MGGNVHFFRRHEYVPLCSAYLGRHIPPIRKQNCSHLHTCTHLVFVFFSPFASEFFVLISRYWWSRECTRVICPPAAVAAVRVKNLLAQHNNIINARAMSPNRSLSAIITSYNNNIYVSTTIVISTMHACARSIKRQKKKKNTETKTVICCYFFPT